MKYDARALEKFTDNELLDEIIKAKNRASYGVEAVKQGTFFDDRIVIKGRAAEYKVELDKLTWEYFRRAENVVEY